jgi:cation-transporting ATPase E
LLVTAPTSAGPEGTPRVDWSDLTHRATLPAIGGGIFLLLSVLVHLRLFVGIDLAVARIVAPLGNDSLDALGQAIALAVSAEASLLYAALAGVFLWRAGRGRWSLAPFAFVLLEPIEFVWKMVVDQPPVPSEFYRPVSYPLATLILRGSFPSGHAMRTAFFCALVAVWLLSRGGWLARIGPAVGVVVALLGGFTRIYLGYHWLSDVVGGLILGASLAIFVAPLIVRSEES